MNFKFLIYNFRPVAAGTALGFLARFIIGAPETGIDNDRHFNEPIHSSELGTDPDSPDFKLKPMPGNLENDE